MKGWWSNRKVFPRGVVIAPRLNAPPFYWQIKVDDGLLTDQEWRELGRKMFFVTGNFCRGKTTIIDQLSTLGFATPIPEVKTRPLRAGEVQDWEIHSETVAGFISALQNDEYVFAHLANPDERCQLAGVRLKDLRQVLSLPDHWYVLNTHPVAAVMLSILSGAPIFQIWANERDLVYFQQQRGVCSKEESSSEDTILLPMENTHFVQNRRSDPMAAALEIQRILSRLNDKSSS